MHNSSQNMIEEVGNSKNNEKNIFELQKKGFEIIDEHSFWVELENWGKVRLVSGKLPFEGKYKICFYLVNGKGDILFNFPDLVDNKMWIFSELKAVSFKDVNKDGLKDIVIIADYITGIGKEGAIPFHYSKIYFQKDKTFMDLPKLDEEINDKQKNDNIDMILKFIEDKNLKI